MIKKPFSLVVLDHHPDMQPPMFGDILSCGGWVQKVIENDPNVRDIHIIGADRKLIGQLDKEAASRVSFYDTRDVFDKNGAVKLPATEHPVFLSVDKDVVLRSELITNWDQGEMSTEELLSFVSEICRRRDIIGVDICGECGTEEESGFLDAVKGNDELNKRLIETILAEIK
jgi:arginase family enzyme